MVKEAPKFPEIPETTHITRRQQLEAKQDTKGTGTRGRKPKNKKTAEEEAEPENAPVETAKPKRKARKTAAKSAPVKPAPAVAGEGPSLEPPQKKPKTVSEGDHAVPDGGEGEVPGEPAPKPKRKARAKKTEPTHEDTSTPPAQETGDVSQVLPKAKAAPKVRAKAAAKSTCKQAKAKATPKSKAKASARSSGSGGPQNRQFVPEAPVRDVPDMPDTPPVAAVAANPNHGQDPNGNLVDPDGLRSHAIKEILQCLRACCEVGTLNTKGKHEHQYEPLNYDLGERRWSVYWSRKAAGVKELRDKKWAELVYFSRQTPCCGTNLVLAKIWVRPSLVFFCFLGLV